MGMSAILVMWPVTFGSKGVSVWNLMWIGHVVSEKTVFFYIDGSPIWVTLAERSTLTFGIAS